TTTAPGVPAIVLLDGEMFMREHGASREEAAATLFDECEHLEEAVVVADYPEQALYCYLDLFHTQANTPSLRGRWAFISTPSVRRMMELLLRAGGRRRDELDPFLDKQYGNNAI